MIISKIKYNRFCVSRYFNFIPEARKFQSYTAKQFRPRRCRRSRHFLLFLQQQSKYSGSLRLHKVRHVILNKTHVGISQAKMAMLWKPWFFRQYRLSKYVWPNCRALSSFRRSKTRFAYTWRDEKTQRQKVNKSRNIWRVVAPKLWRPLWSSAWSNRQRWFMWNLCSELYLLPRTLWSFGTSFACVSSVIFQRITTNSKVVMFQVRRPLVFKHC